MICFCLRQFFIKLCLNTFIKTYFMFLEFISANLFIFFILCLLIILNGFYILFFDNPIYSILYLILVFFCSSFIFMELNLNYLALIILIVYLGALVVLFLFVVMMLNIKFLELNRNINFFPFLFIFFSSFCLINSYIKIDFLNMNFLFLIEFIDWANIFYEIQIFFLFSDILYLANFVNILLISVILFIAMIGAIVLTLASIRQQKCQYSYFQTIYQNNIKLIKNLKK